MTLLAFIKFSDVKLIIIMLKNHPILLIIIKMNCISKSLAAIAISGLVLGCSQRNIEQPKHIEHERPREHEFIEEWYPAPKIPQQTYAVNMERNVIASSLIMYSSSQLPVKDNFRLLYSGQNNANGTIPNYLLWQKIERMDRVDFFFEDAESAFDELKETLREKMPLANVVKSIGKKEIELKKKPGFLKGVDLKFRQIDIRKREAEVQFKWHYNPGRKSNKN